VEQQHLYLCGSPKTWFPASQLQEPLYKKKENLVVEFPEAKGSQIQFSAPKNIFKEMSICESGSRGYS